LLLAVQITPQTVKHSAICPTSSRRRHRTATQHARLRTYLPPMPPASRPTYQTKPIAHTPCSGLVQNIFSSPARLSHVFHSAYAYYRHAAKLKMLCLGRGRPWFAVDAGPMQISIAGRQGLEVCRGCAVGHGKWATAKKYRKDCRWRGCKKRSFWRIAREMRSVPRHAEFLRRREWFHAADFIRGGDRRWISAAVSLSMTFMGPPHLGQR